MDMNLATTIAVTLFVGTLSSAWAVISDIRVRKRESAQVSDEARLYERMIESLQADENRLDRGPAVSAKVVARLSALEARFPDPSTLDQVSSANEAVLAVRIEFLQKQVDSMDRQLLGRGDVVLVFFSLLSTLAAAVALFTWGLNQVNG